MSSQQSTENDAQQQQQQQNTRQSAIEQSVDSTRPSRSEVQRQIDGQPECTAETTRQGTTLQQPPQDNTYVEGDQHQLRSPPPDDDDPSKAASATGRHSVGESFGSASVITEQLEHDGVGSSKPRQSQQTTAVLAETESELQLQVPSTSSAAQTRAPTEDKVEQTSSRLQTELGQEQERKEQRVDSATTESTAGTQQTTEQYNLHQPQPQNVDKHKQYRGSSARKHKQQVNKVVNNQTGTETTHQQLRSLRKTVLDEQQPHSQFEPQPQQQQQQGEKKVDDTATNEPDSDSSRDSEQTEQLDLVHDCSSTSVRHSEQTGTVLKSVHQQHMEPLTPTQNMSPTLLEPQTQSLPIETTRTSTSLLSRDIRDQTPSAPCTEQQDYEGIAGVNDAVAQQLHQYFSNEQQLQSLGQILGAALICSTQQPKTAVKQLCYSRHNDATTLAPTLTQSTTSTHAEDDHQLSKLRQQPDDRCDDEPSSAGVETAGSVLNTEERCQSQQTPGPQTDRTQQQQYCTKIDMSESVEVEQSEKGTQTDDEPPCQLQQTVNELPTSTQRSDEEVGETLPASEIQSTAAAAVKTVDDTDQQSQPVSPTSLPPGTTLNNIDANLLTCTLCKQIYADPRLLPCYHTYCLKCLESLIKNNEPGVPFHCPECDQLTTIPDNGPADLPINSYIQLLVKWTTACSTQHPLTSSVCAVCSKSTKSLQFCKECQQSLCTQCMKVHDRLTASKKHHVTTDRQNVEATVMCKQHREKLVEAFCEDCTEPCCAVCCIQEHRTHNCAPIDDVTNRFRDKLESDVVGLCESVQQCERAVLSVEEAKERFTANTERAVSEIHGESAEMIDRIQQHRQQLEQEVETLSEKYHREHDKLEQKLTRQLNTLKCFGEYCQQFSQHATDVELIRFVIQLHSDKRTFHGDDAISCTDERCDVIFQAVDYRRFMSSELTNYVGWLELHGGWGKSGSDMESQMERVGGEKLGKQLKTWDDLSGEVEEYKRRMEELEGQLERAETDRTSQQETVEQLIEQLSQLHETNAQLQQQLTDTQFSYSTLQQQSQQQQTYFAQQLELLDQLQRTSEQQQQHIAQMTQTELEMQYKLNSLLENCEQNVAALESTRQQLNTSRGEVEMLEGRLQDMEESEEELSQRLELARSQIAEQSILIEHTPPSLVYNRILDSNINHRLAPVYGVTSLGDKLYVIRALSTEVEVYSTVNYRPERHIVVQGLCEVADMTSCSKHHCLYIADYKNEVVHRVDITGTDHVTEWSVGSKPNGLSVTHRHHSVLVASGETRSLLLFSTLGELHYKVELEQGLVVNLRHAVELDSGLFAVCCSVTKCDEVQVQQVSVVDGEGHQLQVYPDVANDEAPEAEQLNGPCHLALDGQRGYMFVADSNNNRVVLVDAELNYVSRLDNVVRGPRCLCLDADRFYVGLCNGSILVYGVQYPTQILDI